MDLDYIDLKTADLHLHTIASDGEMKAEEIIDASGQLGLQTISITDHDGVGAYAGRSEDTKRHRYPSRPKCPRNVPSRPHTAP